MSFQYLALYTGDYLRDTRHLTPEEHGVYLLLLMHCWDQKGPVPLDERRQCGLINARSGGEIESLRRVLGEFFTRMEDGWYNKRMQLEVERSEAISRARSDAGRAGYEARAKKLTSKSQTLAKQLLNRCQATVSIPTPTPIPTPKEKNPLVGINPDDTVSSAGKRGEQRQAALRVLDCLNKNAGRRYEPVDANVNPILARLREGYSEAELRAIAAVKARQWAADERMAVYVRPKTLYNATNAAQYRAELPMNAMPEDRND